MMSVQNSQLKNQSPGPELKYTILIQPCYTTTLKYNQYIQPYINTGYTSNTNIKLPA